MTIDQLLIQLLNRRKVAHKGDFGRVGVLAGSKFMLGAAQLTSYAALKSGSGLVYLYSIADACKIVTAHPELVVYNILQGKFVQDKTSLESLVDTNKCNVMAIGPGLGVSKYTNSLVRSIMLYCNKVLIPCVIDADGLTALENTQWEMFKANSFVLTPHVGEFKRLFPHLVYDENFETRKKIVKQASKATKQIVILKGYKTLVSDGERLFVNNTGNPSMATAGSGDVLTGIIASLIGQSLPLFEAACLGVYLHGKAGDKAHEHLSISLTASDIIEYLQYVFSSIK